MMKPKLVVIALLLLMAVCLFQLASTQTPVIGTGFNSGASDNQPGSATGAVGIQGFDPTTGQWTRLRTTNTTINGPVANFLLGSVPHLFDGNNADPMASAFLEQQLGESTMASNDGTGVIPLNGYNTELGTFNVLKSNKNIGLVTATPLEYAGQSSALGGWVTRTVTNPAAGDFLNLNASATQRLILEQATLSVEGAAAQVDLIATSAAGVTCTALTVRNFQLTTAPNANPTATHTCTTDPVSFDTILRVNLAANTTVVLDLKAYWAFEGSADGISFNVITSPGAGNDLSVNVKFRGCLPDIYC